MPTRLYFLLLILLPTFVMASSEPEAKAISSLEHNQTYEHSLDLISNDLKLISKSIEGIDSSITQVDEKSQQKVDELQKELHQLESLLSVYKQDFEELKKKGVNDTLGMNFSVWTGILLASVTVIVTILGVVIAIGSIFGYRKIMDSSRQEAERVAKKEANEVAKSEISERISKGEFNSLVIEAVDRVAFGNINSNDEYDRRDDV